MKCDLSTTGENILNIPLYVLPTCEYKWNNILGSK